MIAVSVWIRGVQRIWTSADPGNGQGIDLGIATRNFTTPYGFGVNTKIHLFLYIYLI
jgi:hypothetical protein